MFYATKIRMGTRYSSVQSCQDISEIYLEGGDTNQFYTKASLYDHLRNHPDSIAVGIAPYPHLVPAVSSKNEKYVRSEPNDTPYDNLLKLPQY